MNRQRRWHGERGWLRSAAFVAALVLVTGISDALAQEAATETTTTEGAGEPGIAADASDLAARTEARLTALQERDQQIAELAEMVDQLLALLSETQTTNVSRRQTIGALSQELTDAQAARDDVEQKLAATRAERDQLAGELQELLGSAGAVDAQLSTQEARLADAQAGIKQRDRQIVALTESVGGLEEELAVERKLSEEAQDTVNALLVEVEDLQKRTGRLEAALDTARLDAEQGKSRVDVLEQRLAQTHATEVAELSRHRSDFFGRLRETLGDRPDVRVVGDRFVFQSEVLFETGSATLGADGEIQLAKLAATLVEITPAIPVDLQWVLRIDGHTDRRPIGTAVFPSNWALSTARALAVVEFLIDQGVPPERLAAAGFGQHHPIDTRNDEIGFRRNRRIEIKLTQR